MRVWRVETLCVPCLSLLHTNLGKLFFKFSFLTHLTEIIPLLTLDTPSFNLLKTIRSLLSTTNFQKHHRFTKNCSSQRSIMKFKTSTPVSSKKNTANQPKVESSSSKMVEPLTTVPPTKSKTKYASKSTSKKKKTVKKGVSKVALSMSDLYEKENPTSRYISEQSYITQDSSHLRT